MTFDEEFDHLRLYDPARAKGVWTSHFAHGPDSGANAWDSRTLPDNHEEEIYVDPEFAGSASAALGLNSFFVRRGILSIVARPTPARARAWLWGYRYTSGLITTEQSFAQRYGYFEIRAKLPEGRGLWPAFWMLEKDGGWPPEIDILEQLGGHDVFQTVHQTNSGKPVEVGFKLHLPTATTRFHAYGLLWTPERLVWFIDRRQAATTKTPAGLDRPMYLLLNLAVGGDWPGEPTAIRWPAKFQIDYVRAYRWPVSDSADLNPRFNSDQHLGEAKDGQPDSPADQGHDR